MTVQTVAQYAAHTVLEISPVIRLTNASTPEKQEAQLMLTTRSTLTRPL